MQESEFTTENLSNPTINATVSRRKLYQLGGATVVCLALMSLNIALGQQIGFAFTIIHAPLALGTVLFGVFAGVEWETVGYKRQWAMRNKVLTPERYGRLASVQAALASMNIDLASTVVATHGKGKDLASWNAYLAYRRLLLRRLDDLDRFKGTDSVTLKMKPDERVEKATAFVQTMETTLSAAKRLYEEMDAFISELFHPVPATP